MAAWIERDGTLRVSLPQRFVTSNVESDAQRYARIKTILWPEQDTDRGRDVSRDDVEWLVLQIDRLLQYGDGAVRFVRDVTDISGHGRRRD